MDELSGLEAIGVLLLFLVIIVVSWYFTKWSMSIIEKMFRWSFIATRLMMTVIFGMMLSTLVIAAVAALAGSMSISVK